ncbi:hypothetical protein SNE40_022973 [Patella caerulea]|uniref:Uncharacterized protein n=1 Tax=Patella caerulea TaxID=87958 RepID=A0AAN8GG32_PATCE
MKIIIDSDTIATVMSKTEQRLALYNAWLRCKDKIKADYNITNTNITESGLYCPPVFDDVLCWDAAPANTTALQSCPSYVNGFNKREYASRTCSVNGTWYVNPSTNGAWTNYTSCLNPSPQSPDFVSNSEVASNLHLIYTIGYSISLAFLTLAVIIMFCCRRLQSKSNVLHINLFFAFIIRSSVAFLKDLLFVRSLGLAKDVVHLPDGHYEFIQEGTHWECKFIFTLFNFAICACHMWIFVEGLYLYMLIHKPLHIGRKGVNFYVALGWSLPAINMIPWIAVKACLENTFCWNFQTRPEYFWILKGPGIAVVVINFFFFLDIFRILFIRIRSHHQHNGTNYRKLAKFILVLIPLFGIMYMVFYVAFPSGFQENGYNVIYLYMEMTYNSFQGFILALLFCFLNEEVQKEMKRVWYRRQTRKGENVALTKHSLMSSWKKSSLQSVHTPTLRKGQKYSGSSRESSPELVLEEQHVDRSDDLLKHVLKHNADMKINAV